MTSNDNNENQKRRAIREYFSERRRRLPWILIVIGSISLFISIFGLIIIALGAFSLIKHRHLTSEAQIDRWTEEDFKAHDYITRARDLANLGDLVRDPILLRGIANTTGSDGVVNFFRIGKDGYIRSTPLSATVILCTADQVGIYQTGIDLTTGNRVNEHVLEVFYQDVIAISSMAVTESLDTKGFIKELRVSRRPLRDWRRNISEINILRNIQRLTERFRGELIADVLQRDMRKVYRIDFSDGEAVSIPVADGRPTRKANAEVDAEVGNDAAKAMVALRSFVREKKRAILHAEAVNSGPLV